MRCRPARLRVQVATTLTISSPYSGRIRSVAMVASWYAQEEEGDGRLYKGPKATRRLEFCGDLPVTATIEAVGLLETMDEETKT